jgi:hypothetical protein
MKAEKAAAMLGSADGSTNCKKILAINQNSLKLFHVMAVGCVKNDDSITNMEAEPYKSAHEKRRIFPTEG